MLLELLCLCYFEGMVQKGFLYGQQEDLLWEEEESGLFSAVLKR